jgi:hypothetical protein
VEEANEPDAGIPLRVNTLPVIPTASSEKVSGHADVDIPGPNSVLNDAHKMKLKAMFLVQSLSWTGGISVPTGIC